VEPSRTEESTRLPPLTPLPTTTFSCVIQWPTILTWVEISGSIDNDGHVSFGNTLISDRPRSFSSEAQRLDLEKVSEELSLLCLAVKSLTKRRSIGGETACLVSPTEG